MTRDWTKTLLPASFKGFMFRIEQEQLSDGGRHVVVHEYVRGESHDTEDMGRKARKFHIRAYLASDAADDESASLLAILSSKGAGMLVLPVLGSHLVNCTGAKNSSERTKLGYVSLDIEFVEAMAGFAFPVGGLAANFALSAAASVASRIGSTLGLR